MLEISQSAQLYLRSLRPWRLVLGGQSRASRLNGEDERDGLTDEDGEEGRGMWPS
jgi:hypothetical protein